jgi:hypothetical protein
MAFFLFFQGSPGLSLAGLAGRGKVGTKKNVGIEDSHAREEERDYARSVMTPPFSNLTTLHQAASDKSRCKPAQRAIDSLHQFNNSLLK